MIVVAMSGGVDSAVAAALLARQGVPVVGITLRVWPSLRPAAPEARFDSCCSPQAVEDARSVAQALSIPYYVLNYEAEFDREVIQYFTQAYLTGETPNPCVPCNSRLKFGSLYARARGGGATRVATGHYARVEQHPDTGRYRLRRAADARKDQSYFLYSLTQEQLAAALFPVGHLRKEETRRLARELGLAVADKPDSQEICFVPRDYRAYLRERVGAAIQPGTIRDTAGTVRGRHQGIAFYTVGQRRGLGIASSQPLYVIDLDPTRNEVIVGEDRDLWTRELEVERVNLIAIERLSEPRRVLAKVRYAQAPAPAALIPLPGDRLRLCFEEPQRAVAPGQAAVFYDVSDPDLVVGGGTIRRGEQRTTANCGMANAECGIGIGEDAIRGGGGGVRRPPP
ncbi:MAG: tRNA 2-thiouridine(34) synthase MnmA [candidate division NC10 bacterium]|nr:tRNA 2-thiouridine(34) synthase MnmA [candidate division NC10 bacterium]